MYLDNHYYGHSLALHLYAGKTKTNIWSIRGSQLARREVSRRTRVAPIIGQLQHGWAHTGSHFASADSLDPAPVFVWSRRGKESLEGGRRRVVPIGAPFVYLAEVFRQSSVDALTAGEESRPPTTVAYPFHASSDTPAYINSHRDYAAELCERETTRVLVCLHPDSFYNPVIHGIYRRLGFSIICPGTKHNPAYLMNAYRIASIASRAVSNVLSTAIWYAAFLGAEVEIYGDTLGIEDFIDGAEHLELCERLWPSMGSGGMSREEAALAAKSELGYDCLLERDALVEQLGWSGWRRVVGVLGERSVRLRYLGRC